MTNIEKAMVQLQKALREVDPSAMAKAQGRIRTLENRVRTVTRQRDQHRAKCLELRGHIAKYQRELVALRAQAKAKPEQVESYW